MHPVHNKIAHDGLFLIEVHRELCRKKSQMNKMRNGGQMCEAHLHGYCATLNQNELLLSTFRYGSRHDTDQTCHRIIYPLMT